MQQLLTGVVALALYYALVGRHVVARRRVLKRLCAQLVDASDWHDPGLVSSTTGLRRGTRVWLRNERGRCLVIRVALPNWPAGVSITRGIQGDDIGDPQFDELLRVSGDERSWRAMLTIGVRARLVAIFRDSTGGIEDRQLCVRVRDANVVEAILDRCVDFADALPAASGDALERVFDNAARETSAALRASNYRWLVARDWNVLRVYRAASSDPDLAIAAWANQHAPDGVFR